MARILIADRGQPAPRFLHMALEVGGPEVIETADGVTTLRTLAHEHLDVLAWWPDIDLAIAAIRTGAAGVISMPATTRQVLRCAAIAAEATPPGLQHRPPARQLDAAGSQVGGGCHGVPQRRTRSTPHRADAGGVIVSLTPRAPEKASASASARATEPTTSEPSEEWPHTGRISEMTRRKDNPRSAPAPVTATANAAALAAAASASTAAIAAEEAATAALVAHEAAISLASEAEIPAAAIEAAADEMADDATRRIRESAAAVGRAVHCATGTVAEIAAAEAEVAAAAADAAADAAALAAADALEAHSGDEAATAAVTATAAASVADAAATHAAAAAATATEAADKDMEARMAGNDWEEAV